MPKKTPVKPKPSQTTNKPKDSKSLAPKEISSSKRFNPSKRTKLIIALIAVAGLITVGFGGFALYQNLSADAINISACGSNYKYIKTVKAFPWSSGNTGRIVVYSRLSNASRDYCVIGSLPKPSEAGYLYPTNKEYQGQLTLSISTANGRAISGMPTSTKITGNLGNKSVTSKPVYIRDTNCEKANIKVSFTKRWLLRYMNFKSDSLTYKFTVDTLKDWCN